ncbi:MAG: ACP S-malonyltransferase [Myxococcaceae bacterium]
MRTAFLFPGQGSQAVGMGQSLAQAFPEARAVFAAVDDALGERLSSSCFSGPAETLALTANTQPAILAVSLAAHAVWAARAPAPSYLAGHSLGEYSALVAAGALGLADAARAVRSRGLFMQEAVPKGEGAMAAVLGLEAARVAELCQQLSGDEVLSPANYNTPEQTVVAGHARAVERAVPRFKEAGAKRVVPLNVSAPFHCALMAPVVPRLEAVLASVRVEGLRTPVVSNVEAKPNAEAARVVPLLLAQVTAPVRWVECILAMVSSGVTRMVELGPGRVLTGLVRSISREVQVLNVEDVPSLEKALLALAAKE